MSQEETRILDGIRKIKNERDIFRMISFGLGVLVIFTTTMLLIERNAHNSTIDQLQAAWDLNEGRISNGL